MSSAHSVRGELLWSLYDCPGEIKRISGKVHKAWFEVFDCFCGILPENHGFSVWAGTLSVWSFYMLQCDFCYMISPEMFDEFVLRELRESCRKLERSFYHLDGKGELPYLPQILSSEEFDGVQWVCGAGAVRFSTESRVTVRSRRRAKRSGFLPEEVQRNCAINRCDRPPEALPDPGLHSGRVGGGVAGLH